MSNMSKTVLLLGDSNVCRWITRIGAPYLPIVDYVPVYNAEEVPAALNKVRSSHQIVVFAGLTNIIVGAGSTATDRFSRLEAIEKALKATLTQLSETMASVQDPSYFLAMPTVRRRPEWFLQIHPDLTHTILAILKFLQPAPRALRAVAMSGQDLDSDGIHLNAISGIPYVQSLIDQPRALVEISASEGPSDGFNLLSDNIVTISSTLVAHELQLKVLSDQLMLSRCQQAEEACGRINVDNLHRLIIVGGPYLPLSEQLQAKLRSQVAFFIKMIGPNLPTDIAHVRQFKGRRGAIYDAEMSSAASSNRIRTAYGMFYRRGSQGPPPGLAKISVTNSLTYATRVRVRMLKEIAKKHKIANPDMQVFVTNYLPRPTLKLRDKKGPMQTFTFCEAMLRFSQHLSQEFLIATAKFANVHVSREDLAPTFLLLSSDMLRGSGYIPSSPSEGPPPPTTKLTPPAVGPSPTPGTSSGTSKKRRAIFSATPNLRPTFPKKGRTVRLQKGHTTEGGKGKGRGKNSSRAQAPPTEPMDTATASSGEDEPAAAIQPIDFSQEAED